MVEQQNQIPSFTFNNGVKFPSIGLGTLTYENHKIGADQSIVTQSIRAALDNGYRHFDTAIFYNNHKEIGVAFAEIFKEGKYKREDVFLTTKIFPIKTWNGIQKLQESLTDLQFTYVDLYLIHVPATPPAKVGDNIAWTHKPHHVIWAELEECYKMKLTRAIGVSNFNVQSLVDILSFCTIKPVNNQIEINPYNVPKGIIDFCKKFDIVVTSYSSLSKGGLEKAKSGLGGNVFDIFNEPILVEVAKKHNKSVAQVVLNYINKVLGVVVIPKSSNPQRVADNIKIFDFSLDAEDIKKIDSLNKMERTLDFSKMPPWLGIDIFA